MRNVLISIVFFVLCGCSPEGISPSHVANIDMGQDTYVEFTSAMDAVMMRFGYNRIDQSGNLSKIMKRNVYFSSYQNTSISKWHALDFGNLKKENEIEIRFYDKAFGNSEYNRNFFDDISRVIVKFGGKLASV